MAEKSLELPCGRGHQGMVERLVDICKLKGRIQRDVAKLASKKNPNNSEILDAILRPSIVSFGGQKLTGQVLAQLLLADRDWLMFEIVKFTRGAIVTLKEKCPAENCGEMGDYPNFDLDQFTVDSLDDDSTPWWDGEKVVPADEIPGLGPEERKKLKCRVFVVKNDELGIEGVFRYPNGHDQKAISDLQDQQVEALWRLTSRTCLQWKDPEREIKKAPPGGLKSSFWEDLDLDLLDWTQEAYGDAMPGVDSRTELECFSCGHEFEVTVTASDFLFRVAPRNRSRSTQKA